MAGHGRWGYAQPAAPCETHFTTAQEAAARALLTVHGEVAFIQDTREGMSQCSVVHIAAYCGRPAILEWLLDHAGASATSADEVGIVAALRPSPFVSSSCVFSPPLQLHGRTPLHWACASGSGSDSVSFLLPRLTRDDLETRDDVRAPPCPMSSVLCVPNGLPRLEQTLVACRYLTMTTRMPPNPQNGATALHLAAETGSVPVVQALVQAGCSTRAKDKVAIACAGFVACHCYGAHSATPKHLAHDRVAIRQLLLLPSTATLALLPGSLKPV